MAGWLCVTIVTWINDLSWICRDFLMLFLRLQSAFGGTPAFGAAQSSPAFGSQPFGSTPANPFGGGGAFQQSQPAFGSSGFGASSSAFGSTPFGGGGMTLKEFVSHFLCDFMRVPWMISQEIRNSIQNDCCCNLFLGILIILSWWLGLCPFTFRSKISFWGNTVVIVLSAVNSSIHNYDSNHLSIYRR